jgi:uncharacterized protein YbjT (DUF2867 family)
MTEKIIVAGGTGRTGQIIVNKLVANGVHPHVLVRDIPKANTLFGAAVTLHAADVRDLETLIEPLQGVDALISAVGTCTPVGGNCPRRVDYEGVVNLVQAAQRTGVRRFILISSIAVTHPEHPLNRFGKILDCKLKGEDVLRQSGLDYTIIRPGGLTDKPGGSNALIFGQGDQITGMLSRDDLAEICLQALQHPHLSRVTFEAIDAGKKGFPNWVNLFVSLQPD